MNTAIGVIIYCVACVAIAVVWCKLNADEMDDDGAAVACVLFAPVMVPFAILLKVVFGFDKWLNTPFKKRVNPPEDDPDFIEGLREVEHIIGHD
jgi:hypothetical protein